MPESKPWTETEREEEAERGKQEIEIQTEMEKHEKRMREVGAKPDNELLRDKL